MYAQLGTIRFEGMYGFDALSRRREVIYAVHQHIDGKPRLQRTGIALDTITVGIRLHSQFVDPEANLRRLYEAQTQEEALPLVLGNGTFVGDFVIQSIDEVTDKTDASGNIVAARAELTLLEFFDPNRERTEQIAAQDRATSLARNNPPTVTITSPRSAAAEAAQAMQNSTVAVGAVGEDVQKLEHQTSQREQIFESVRSGIDKVEDGLETYRSAVFAGMAEYRNAQEIIENIDMALTIAGDLRAAADAENVADALEANRALRDSMNGVERASSGFVAQIATRRL